MVAKIISRRRFMYWL